MERLTRERSERKVRAPGILNWPAIRSRERRCVRALFAALLAFALALPCLAADPTVALESRGTGITFSGRPGSDQSLTVRLSLVATAAIPELLFRPEDLQPNDRHREPILRTQLQIMSAEALKKLEANTPRDLDLKVTAIKAPGQYSGKLNFVLPGHGSTAALSVDLRLDVKETPRLTLRKGAETIKLQLTNCSWMWCQLGPRLGYLVVTQDLPVPLDNGSVLPFTVTSAAASAMGDVHHLSTGNAMIVASNVEIPAKPIITVPLTLNSETLAPDRYTGDLQLRLPGKDDPVKIPLELNVRDSPTLPWIVLIVGVLLGRFIKYMNDKGTPQADLFRQYLRLESRAGQDPVDLRVLQSLLHRTRLEIEDLEFEKAKADLTLLDNRLTLLARLRGLESLLGPRSQQDEVAAILGEIKAARERISCESDPTDIAKDIEDRVKILTSARDAAGVDRDLTLAAAASVRGVAPMAMNAPLPNKLGAARRFIATVTGHQEPLRAEFASWVWRPVLWFILVIISLLTGFAQLYLKNPTFGSEWFGDYFALLVWAISADITGRTLTSIKSPV